jgi:hypothetical protein
MTKAITKEKGDTGLIQVIADLDRKGIKVALPISEHLPFDLIAISANGKLARLSVKYVGLVNGSIVIPLRSISTNTQGWKAKTIDFSDIDAIAVYCPENQNCYYIKSSFAKDFKSGISLRIEKAKRKGKFNIAADYLTADIFNDTLI